jgi:DNA-binding winged helix-turn-helix (wHTH) protein
LENRSAAGLSVAFGPFRLDAAKRRLWHDDVVVALTPKAFDTLVVLVTERHRVSWFGICATSRLVDR